MSLIYEYKKETGKDVRAIYNFVNYEYAEWLENKVEVMRKDLGYKFGRGIVTGETDKLNFDKEEIIDTFFGDEQKVKPKSVYIDLEGGGMCGHNNNFSLCGREETSCGVDIKGIHYHGHYTSIGCNKCDEEAENELKEKAKKLSEA